MNHNKHCRKALKSEISYFTFLGKIPETYTNDKIRDHFKDFICDKNFGTTPIHFIRSVDVINLFVMI